MTRPHCQEERPATPILRLIKLLQPAIRSCPLHLKARIAAISKREAQTALGHAIKLCLRWRVYAQPKTKRPNPRSVLPFQKRTGSWRNNSRASALSSRAHLSNMELRNFAQALG